MKRITRKNTKYIKILTSKSSFGRQRMRRRSESSLKNSAVSCLQASGTGSDSLLPYRIDFKSRISLVNSFICKIKVQNDHNICTFKTWFSQFEAPQTIEMFTKYFSVIVDFLQGNFGSDDQLLNWFEKYLLGFFRAHFQS